MVSLDWILLGLRLLSTAILYAFLGFAFYIIWRDLKQANPTNVRAEVALCQLRVVTAGDEQLLKTGQLLPLQPVTILGQDPNNTIVINDTAASNRHARISRENGGWWLEDLGSKNGTMLNELPASKPTTLVNGDVIGIGQVRFRVELG